jgi:hypothetical protein
LSRPSEFFLPFATPVLQFATQKREMKSKDRFSGIEQNLDIINIG